MSEESEGVLLLAPDGNFYEITRTELAKFLIPKDKVEERILEAEKHGLLMAPQAEAESASQPPVPTVINIFVGGTPADPGTATVGIAGPGAQPLGGQLSKYASGTVAAKYAGGTTAAKYAGGTTAAKYAGGTTAAKYAGGTTAAKYAGGTVSVEPARDQAGTVGGGEAFFFGRW